MSPHTDTTYMRPSCPYGFVGISVPDPAAPYVFPDGKHADSVLEYCGTPKEREKFRQGALGEEAFLFLRILQQYLFNHLPPGQYSRTANADTRTTSPSPPMYRQCPRCGIEIGLRDRCPGCGYTAPVTAVTHPRDTGCPVTVWFVLFILGMWGIFQVGVVQDITSSMPIDDGGGNYHFVDLNVVLIKTVYTIICACGLILAILLVCRIRVARNLTFVLFGLNIIALIWYPLPFTLNYGSNFIVSLCLNCLLAFVCGKFLYGDQAREFFYKPPPTQRI